RLLCQAHIQARLPRAVHENSITQLSRLRLRANVRLAGIELRKRSVTRFPCSLAVCYQLLREEVDHTEAARRRCGLANRNHLLQLLGGQVAEHDTAVLIVERIAAGDEIGRAGLHSRDSGYLPALDGLAQDPIACAAHQSTAATERQLVYIVE